ncbi:LamG domain-containing protein [Nonomuraea angiospora]|uniref:LamG domain-containing protein n=1 Tax=Nonomuraea angiospora TaxID=46172 RepID=UPI0029BF2CA5|nr:LamG domain-containing protein [Nonomuraea angiospora]MDX3103714.1 LamG domain-containing protein [Nonomuraea angiospora]
MSIAVPAGTLTDGWKLRWRLRAVTGDASSAWSDWKQVTVDVTQPGEEPLAQTTGPVIRTDQSFTAAAWLRWSDKDGDYTVVERKGTHQAPFRLGNEPLHGLVFTFTGADAADATVEGVLSDVEPPVGEWFHLAGVYDAAAKTASLYLNGNLVKTSPVSFATWHADGAMTLGSRMRGDLDEVNLFQQPLGADEVAALLTSPATAASRPAAPSAAPSAALADGDFDYEHPSLEECHATQRAPRFTDSYSRMQERPYNACWTAWIGYTGWEEEDDGGVKKRKPAAWTLLFPPQLRIPAMLVNQLHPGDVFSFRATWVAHSYLGSANGREVYEGGDSTNGLRPQNMKFWLKFSDFGIYNTGIRRSELDDELEDMQLQFGLKTSPSCKITEGTATQNKTIKAWRGTYLEYLLEASKPEAGKKDNVVCSVMPAITAYEGKKGDLPLWDQELLSTKGKRLGVVRWGHGVPANDLWAPSFRCDWRELRGHNFGGCIYIRADRVFTMSKTKNHNFREVIAHIEKALDQDKNADTNPPYRLGDTTADRDDEYPPAREKTGTERFKSIPGNYAAAPGTTAGLPLWRGTDGNDTVNRRVFSGHRFWVHKGTDREFYMGDAWGSNYCKYYNEDMYDERGIGATRCDEYPFASTEEGAAKDRLNYSVQAVWTSHNDRHEQALQDFYSQYRLLTYNPDHSVSSESPCWVKIVD